ncbi:hypothetical protein BT69DRAFT_1365925 [Atractiella rhizophila]|nr:hypothetical protein BT69DRAFT_1365925 [Atractiella rhizophila]
MLDPHKEYYAAELLEALENEAAWPHEWIAVGTNVSGSSTLPSTSTMVGAGGRDDSFGENEFTVEDIQEAMQSESRWAGETRTNITRMSTPPPTPSNQLGQKRGPAMNSPEQKSNPRHRQRARHALNLSPNIFDLSPQITRFQITDSTALPLPSSSIQPEQPKQPHVPVFATQCIPDPHTPSPVGVDVSHPLAAFHIDYSTLPGFLGYQVAPGFNLQQIQSYEATDEVPNHVWGSPFPSSKSSPVLSKLRLIVKMKGRPFQYFPTTAGGRIGFLFRMEGYNADWSPQQDLQGSWRKNSSGSIRTIHQPKWDFLDPDYGWAVFKTKCGSWKIILPDGKNTSFSVKRQRSYVQ